MLAVKTISTTGQILHAHIRSLVEERFKMLIQQYPEPYDPGQHGWFIVVEPGDQLNDVISHGCPSLLSDCDGIEFGEDSYFSPYEFCDDLGDCYELVRVISDYGEAISIFIPKHPEVAAPLLQMCAYLSESQ